MQNADVKSEFYNGILHFRLMGEIDHHTAKAIREKMDEDIFFHRPKVTVIILGNLDFMDSSGLGLILGRYTKMKDLGGTLILQDPTAEIEKILRLAGVNRLIEIKQSDRMEEKQNEKRKDQ
ncbi:MAG: STAS domain-containing protein [Ruminococcaceae bacterium]|nr:STAS domain-containing protein [Oscillospiraceae bacterium]